MRILLIANTGWYLYKFRYNLIKTLLDQGVQICISCPEDEYSQILVNELGLQWHDIPANPRRIIPHKELIFAYKLLIACLRFKPDFCLTYTPRVNCYIALVPLKTLGIKLIRNISGVGDSISSSNKLQTLLASFLYRRTGKQYWTFYQNEQDMLLGLDENFSKANNTSLLPGSGVDLDHFTFTEKIHSSKPLKILMAARLIPAKGYLDFIALSKLYKHDSTIDFHLVGEFSKESGVSESEFEKLIEDSDVNFHGYTEDLVPLYEKSHVFVLPSTYGEGLPRVLLEAAACGCALLAYDNAGSNRAIEHGTNGWILKPGSVESMHQTIENYIAMPNAERLAMSRSSRKHVENGFSEELVINAYLKLLTFDSQ